MQCLCKTKSISCQSTPNNIVDKAYVGYILISVHALNIIKHNVKILAVCSVHICVFLKKKSNCNLIFSQVLFACFPQSGFVSNNIDYLVSLGLVNIFYSICIPIFLLIPLMQSCSIQ